MFTQRISRQHRDNFIVLKIKGYSRVVVGCSYNLLAFEENFDLGDDAIIKWIFFEANSIVLVNVVNGVINTRPLCRQ